MSRWRSTAVSMGVVAKLKDFTMKRWPSAAGHGRNEYHGVALRQRLGPVAELGIDGDAQALGPQGERMAPLQLRVQVARRACRRRDGLVAATGLLAQNGVVL